MSNVPEDIDASIQRLLSDFLLTPNKYLTEDDVKIHLCFYLFKYFGDLRITKDNDLSIPLHSEVRWWGPKKRNDRTDIVIFDVSELSATKSVVEGLFKFGQIPQKGYGISRPLAAIELKLRRNDGCSDNEFIRSVKEDVSKLEDLINMMDTEFSTKLACRVVALDKKKQINEWHAPNSPVQVVYRFANIAGIA